MTTPALYQNLLILHPNFHESKFNNGHQIALCVKDFSALFCASSTSSNIFSPMEGKIFLAAEQIFNIWNRIIGLFLHLFVKLSRSRPLLANQSTHLNVEFMPVQFLSEVNLSGLAYCGSTKITGIIAFLVHHNCFV